MKFNINRIRTIVFMIAAFGYLPLQSADKPSSKSSVKTDVKIEKKTDLKKTDLKLTKI